jgi:hypothetical protein
VALYVGLGGRASEHVRVDVDESQVLTLVCTENLSSGVVVVKSAKDGV